MSRYISIDDYDRHEEEHAYYQEMMQCMLTKIASHQDGKGETIQILELGAGTGIFTKRLAKLGNVSVTAVEIDSICYEKLKQRFDGSPSVRTIYGDSCSFFEQDRRFDFVCSSFADHHISHSEKLRYLENVKRSLSPQGLFIVGDEFLRPHNLFDRHDRSDALKAYHHHIIEIAEQNGSYKLAELERGALQSGIEEIGDFKVSNQQYEELLLKAGFHFEAEKIGPKDKDDIGGIYVYMASLCHPR